MAGTDHSDLTDKLYRALEALDAREPPGPTRDAYRELYLTLYRLAT